MADIHKCWVGIPDDTIGVTISRVFNRAVVDEGVVGC